MKDWWLKFGCFLTGYNYNLVKRSSEASAKTVKKYTSAILIVSIFWAFVGYTFADQYLRTDLYGSIAAAIVMVVVIIQIERQIILSVHKNPGFFLARAVIAVVMALLGSVIVDQIIFKEDIEKRKITNISEEVDRILPGRSRELRQQIVNLDSLILIKEVERQELIAELTANPTIQMPSYQTIRKPVRVPRIIEQNGEKEQVYIDTVITENIYTNSSEPNPKAHMLGGIDDQLARIRGEKAAKEDQLITLRLEIEDELMSKVGFLDELQVMFSMLTTSTVALVFWSLWLLIFFGIELFVLLSKIGDKENDYDQAVLHQMRMISLKLEQLGKQRTV